MSRRLVIKNQAARDLRQQAEYILQQGNVTAAEEFLAAAEATFAQLTDMPGMGKAVQLSLSLGEVRRWRVRGFEDYLIFYRLQEPTLEILRILHGARDLADILADLDHEF